jgi:nucleoside 2-deoxyribosyltransferase
MKIYFAGPLFTLAEKNFNRSLRDELVALGHEVFLPQESEVSSRVALDHLEVAREDQRAIYKSDVLIANLDGAMVDDGTAVEVGMAIAKGKKTVGYRTDFRVSGDDPKIHVNLMFRLMDWVILYSGGSIQELAQMIHIALVRVCNVK